LIHVIGYLCVTVFVLSWMLAGCVALLANVEFDEDRGKSPPVDVLPEPEGLEVRAAGGSYGSGLASVRSETDELGRETIVDRMIEALRSSGWQVAVNDAREITAVSSGDVTAQFSYTGDRWDFETSGFGIDVPMKAERIVRISLEYPNGGIGYEEPVEVPLGAIAWLAVATAGTVAYAIFRRRERRRTATAQSGIDGPAKVP
jgi:hypothetical protein